MEENLDLINQKSDSDSNLQLLKAAKNLPESFKNCIQIICHTTFSANDIPAIISRLPKNNDKSIQLIQTLLAKNYDKLSRKELQSICTLGIEVVIVLLTHEDKLLKKHVFNHLTISDFAEIAATPDYRHDVKKLLEIGLLEKLLGKEVSIEDTSNALSILLNSENGAKNTDIFNFIYNNKTTNFIPVIKREHLVKSFSYPLDSDDSQLKSRLANASSKNNLLFNRLENEDVFQIFLDAQKNNYTLPSDVLQVLTRIVLQLGKDFFKELLPFLEQKRNENYSLKETKNTLYLFILEAHKVNREHPEFYQDQFDSLIDHLKLEPKLLIAILRNQPEHEHILSFFNDNDISSLLNPEDTIELFLVNSTLNPENQLFITEAFMPFLSEETIMQIFIALAKNKCMLDIEAQKRLVEKLNFKRLNQLVKNFTQEDKENVFNLQDLKRALDNIFYSQIQRQKATFSIPAFILSLLYGIIYYPTIGWALHSLAPKTTPFYLYKNLKKFFHPPEVARIKQETFRKIQLEQIGNDPLLAKPNSIIIENIPDDESEWSFFNRETKEIKPFRSQVESSYIYLFPDQKEALKLKKESNEHIPPTQPFNIQ